MEILSNTKNSRPMPFFVIKKGLVLLEWKYFPTPKILDPKKAAKKRNQSARSPEQQLIREIEKKINYNSRKEDKKQVERKNRNNKDPHSIVFQ